ncbi:MAG TPA: adenosylcobinamide-GDP ribazoletransferase [Dokdonella sp.]
MNSWAADLRTSVAFLTRLPMPHPHGPTPPDFARATRLFPLVGAAIGALIAALCIGLRAAGVPDLAAAAMALGAGALLTGGLHEDGLADVADGFGGGTDRARKLEIMRDSRLGTYGALILIVTFVTKLSAVAACRGEATVRGLIVAHALARAVLPCMSMSTAIARKDGLAANAGRPSSTTVATAVALGMGVVLVTFPLRLALGAVLVTAACAIGMVWLARRQIGGLTGDVLGATEQLSETAILVLVASVH